MSKTIAQIQALWEKESNSYKTQEVGSGVQRLVKYMLECPEIFNLKEGALSTPPEKWKNEFIYEKKTKGGRRADFAIYISSDIIIPIEVEQYTNIQQGEGQLFQYQSDFEKKFGILTDGYTWRFYNNSLYRTFTLDHLLSDTSYFIEFWQEYIKPEYYYLSFFEESGQLSFLGKEELHIEENRQLFFQDITTLIKSFTNKLRIEGYFSGLDRKEALKKANEITYAYTIQFILYKTLVDNKFDDFGNDYNGRIETIHNAIKSRSYKDILGVIEGISHVISENIYHPFIKEQEYIHDKLLKLYYKAKNELSDVSPWLDIVVFIKKYNFQNVHNDIFGYVYENYLKELYEEEEKRGQYFTDPSVVNFMLEQIGYTAQKIKSKIKANELDKMSIVDPACGSGTFLYSATNEIVKSFSTITDKTSKQVEEIVTSNVFGLDVEEFPLYLAEMNILMRMLHLIMGEKYNNPLDKKIKMFWTQDSIAEFIGSGLITLGTQISFPDTIIKPKFESFMRTEEDLTEMKESMASFPRRRFDFVIANPPYVSYNECSKQGLLVFNLIKKRLVHLSDILGVNLHSIPSKRKKYSPKPNLFIFFIALGLALLKDEGRLCYIIPQTLLVNADFDVIRYHLAKFSTIERIIIFSGKMFVGRGLTQDRPIPTSSLIIVVNRQKPTDSHRVEVINYEDSNDEIEVCLQNISNSKKTSKKSILQVHLLQNVANWNFLKQDEMFTDFYEELKRNTEDIEIYYDHNMAEQRFGERFYFDGSTNIPKKDVLSVSLPNKNYYLIPELKSEGYVAKVVGQYPKDKEIKIAEGSQGLIIAEPQNKILWKYINFDKFYFLKGDHVLPIYQQYCITSSNELEVFYLFSILNSAVVLSILNAFCKVQHEDKLSFLLGLTHIKQLVRVPKITEANKLVKDEIIKCTKKLLNLEEVTLSDFVDFSGILMQKFDDVQVEANTLVLLHDNQKTKLQIKGDTALIAGIIAKEYGARGLKLEKRRTNLSELRNLQVIDFKKQAIIKDYIDDLVFALYFNIPLKKVEVRSKEYVRKACLSNKYYETCN